MKISYKDIIIGEHDVTEITMTNKNKMEVSFLNLGGIITRISVPDLEGDFNNVVLAHQDYNDYLENKGYIGGIIGRTAGRIKDAKFILNDIEYNLSKNYGENSGHGGYKGFDKQLFSYEPSSERCEIKLNYLSKDLEEGYPGNIGIEVTYTLNDENEFTIDYKAKSDQDTLVNLTNHTYFNLSGDFKESILYHELFIAADEYAELLEDSSVSGRLSKVENSPFDFRYHHEIGEEINHPHEQIKIGDGYDHPFILREDREVKLRLLHRFTGRILELETNHDAIVVYTQNYTDEQIINNNQVLERRKAIALEAQSLPIGSNGLNMEFSFLKANEPYHKWTKYRFNIENIPDFKI